jgi:hypothetical protein
MVFVNWSAKIIKITQLARFFGKNLKKVFKIIEDNYVDTKLPHTKTFFAKT